MSAKQREETDSEGRWFGEDFEKMERVGTTAHRFDENEDRQQSNRWEDETYEKQFYHQPESNQKQPPVTMETASTDGSDLLRKSAGEGDLYTSLLSNQNYSFRQGISTDSKSKAQDWMPSLETHSMFSSDSGIEMTPGESMDFTKNLLESDKTEAYNYMDISHGEKPQSVEQQQVGGALGSWGEVTGPALGQYMEKSASSAVETLGPALDSQTCPYVEDPSDEEPSDRQPRPRQAPGPAASPITITLTETDCPAPLCLPQVTVSDRDSILSLGLQGIPTVTLSEPEDDSPGSSTPPFTEESDSPSEPLFQASGVGAVSSVQDQASVTSQKQPGPPTEVGAKPLKTESHAPVVRDLDGSSAESGDSEIELVSEEPPPRKQPSAPAPPTPPAPPVIQYSILREEREAELDSELVTDSFDASSASEESPKRAQSYPAQKAQRAASRLADVPPVPASHAPLSPPAVATPASPPGLKETAPVEKAPVSGHVGDGPAAKPKPPPAAVEPPEVRREQTLEDKAGKKRRASQGRRDSEKRVATAVFLQGLDRQKGIERGRAVMLELWVISSQLGQPGLWAASLVEESL
ncbi:hypothetical protein COCON_G00095030 [Conger conger]|uniref:Uncharacterized protein n=1 Tax=Conger conger TaxID=82655 RepID=A0A9Q1DLZ6_CONCO|nr:hypothetical protein COCON_G00095030 [Conger conger]